MKKKLFLTLLFVLSLCLSAHAQTSKYLYQGTDQSASVDVDTWEMFVFTNDGSAEGTMPIAQAFADMLGAAHDTEAKLLALFSARRLKTSPFVKDGYIEYPASSGESLMKLAFPVASTITRFECSTDTGTATINMTNDGDTDYVLSSDVVCDTDGQTGTIDTGEDDFAQYHEGQIEIIETADSPTQVWFHVYYTED